MIKKWKRDYPEYDKKKIQWIGGLTTTVVVVGCCYDIGITIMGEDGPEDYRLCLPHPSTKAAENICYVANVPVRKSMAAYNKMFKMCVDMIECGEYHANAIDHIFMPLAGNDVSSAPDSSVCVWS